MEDENVLDLEALECLAHTASADEIFGTDLLLRQPGGDLIARAQLEPARTVEGVVDLVGRSLHHRVTHTRALERKQGELGARRGRAHAVAGLDGSATLGGRQRVALEDLRDDRAPHRLLGTPEKRAGLRMTDLAPLAHRLEHQPGLRAGFPADREGQGCALCLDDLAVELGEEGDRLIDE